MKAEKRGKRKRLAPPDLDVEAEAVKLLPEWCLKLRALIKEALAEVEKERMSNEGCS